MSQNDFFSSSAQIEPRPYQSRIVNKAISLFEGQSEEDAVGPVKHLLIESPTGSGKTVMGLAIAKWMQQHRGDRVGWVAMRRNLLAQAAAENLRRGFGVKLELISMFDKHPPQVDLLVVDEAQHDAAHSMANLHSQIQPRRVLGLTATPFRTDRIKLCFDKVITDAGIHCLIEDGYLSRYHHYTIPKYTPQSVAECYAREPERWGKSIIFFHRHADCVACQQALAAAGHRAEVVTACSSRERQLADFEAGRVNILINMAILTEGFDCPELKTAFCRPSGRGCTVQMGGRVFRKHPEIPFKQIVQCQETRHPFVKTAQPEEQYVWSGGRWRSLRMNAELAQISRNALRRIAGTDVQLPQLVKMHRPRSTPWAGSRISD